MPSPVISPEELVGTLGEGDVTVVEVSFLESARAPYGDSHVPGARFAYWKDLLWHETRREFAAPEVLAQRLGALGVGDGTRLVLMGDRVQMSAYAYWVLSGAGLARGARILDGARATWVARGLPLTREVPSVEERVLSVGEADGFSRISRDEVRNGLGEPGRVIVDLRSSEEYRGERVAPLSSPYDHGAERAGHIPGALNLPHERLLAPDGTFRAPEEIADLFDELGAATGVDVITTCRLGHRAALGWFLLTHLLERGGVRVYDGSWTEWGSVVGLPIER